MRYKRMVIGIDQSYTKTGISIGIDGKLVKVTSIDFKGLRTKSEKRKEIKRVLTLILKKNHQKASECLILCERIRTFSNHGNRRDRSHGLRPDYLKSTGALVATIVDVAFDYNVPVYSVDTRSWKSKIVGTSKPDKHGNRKGPTIKFVENLGFNLFIRNDRNGNPVYDDDAADSACICLYGFLPKSQQNLKREE